MHPLLLLRRAEADPQDVGAGGVDPRDHRRVLGRRELRAERRRERAGADQCGVGRREFFLQGGEGGGAGAEKEHPGAGPFGVEPGAQHGKDVRPADPLAQRAAEDARGDDDAGAVGGDQVGGADRRHELRIAPRRLHRMRVDAGKPARRTRPRLAHARGQPGDRGAQACVGKFNAKDLGEGHAHQDNGASASRRQFLSVAANCCSVKLST